MRPSVNGLIANIPSRLRATVIRMLDADTLLVHTRAMPSSVTIMDVLANSTVDIHIVMCRSPIVRECGVHATMRHSDTSIMVEDNTIKSETATPLIKVVNPHIRVSNEVLPIHLFNSPICLDCANKRISPSGAINA